MRKQYKEIFSDFRTWGQLEHAENYLLFHDNIGENLSNGDVYTTFTNKSAYGRKGAIVAMVNGVSSETVSAIFKQLSQTYLLQ